MDYNRRARWLNRLKQGNERHRALADTSIILAGIIELSIGISMVALLWLSFGDGPWIWIGIFGGIFAAWCFHSYFICGLSLPELKVEIKEGSNQLLGIARGLLILIAFALLIVFPFLSTSNQRNIYFAIFPNAPLPEGSFAPVIVSSSSVERHFWMAESVAIVLEPASPIANMPVAFNSKASPGLEFKGEARYTLECEIHFWNRCEPLEPGHTYFVRWVSANRKDLALGRPTNTNVSYISASDAAIYKVVRWQKIENR